VTLAKKYFYRVALVLKTLARSVHPSKVIQLLHPDMETQIPGNTKRGSITVPLTSCLTGLESAVTTDNFCIYLQNRLIQTSETGGQRYSDTFPFIIPCTYTRSPIHIQTGKNFKCLFDTFHLTICFAHSAHDG
jgi:hypothetical protein